LPRVLDRAYFIFIHCGAPIRYTNTLLGVGMIRPFSLW
jgi:hypothetical protein